MELRRVETEALDLGLGRLRQLPEGAVRRMAASLGSKGQLTPLVAAESEGRLMLVDGFVRLLAAQRAGLDSVLVEVVQLSPVQMKVQLYLRNRERGLTLVEECRLVRELVDLDGLSQVEVADLLERHKSWVCRRLSLARDVSPSLLEEAALGRLGAGSLRGLAQLPARNQEELWAVARREELSSADTAALVELWRRAPDPEARRYLVEQPREALARMRGTPSVPEDARLGGAGRELLAALVTLRRTSLRIVARLRGGLGELPVEGLSLLATARSEAATDSAAALREVQSWLVKAGAP